MIIKVSFTTYGMSVLKRLFSKFQWFKAFEHDHWRFFNCERYRKWRHVEDIVFDSTLFLITLRTRPRNWLSKRWFILKRPFYYALIRLMLVTDNHKMLGFYLYTTYEAYDPVCHTLLKKQESYVSVYV